MSTADDPSECGTLREDYFECLHHKKEITRQNAVEERRATLINEKGEKLKAEIWKDVFDSSWTKVEPKEKEKK
jgi:NADH dehydrogenase (ubiquinone) Fe-S protein 5|tara:strand:+ start:16878 stop:17096 length:219 start_codon:yes stop_codon:yes gene_type:complete